jgi:hypothetical protein
MDRKDMMDNFPLRQLILFSAVLRSPQFFFISDSPILRLSDSFLGQECPSYFRQDTGKMPVLHSGPRMKLLMHPD